jgi:predicted DNA-binding protein (MmcQ/YjbR family)
MNKKHWNTIAIAGELSDEEIKHWIVHSYDLVVSKLTKKEKNELNEL